MVFGNGNEVGNRGKNIASITRVILTILTSERRIAPRSADNYYLERLLRELRGHPQAWPFQKPVDGDEVVDYYDVIKNPMGGFYWGLCCFSDTNTPF